MDLVSNNNIAAVGRISLKPGFCWAVSGLLSYLRGRANVGGLRSCPWIMSPCLGFSILFAPIVWTLQASQAQLLFPAYSLQIT